MDKQRNREKKSPGRDGKYSKVNEGLETEEGIRKKSHYTPSP